MNTKPKKVRAKRERVPSGCVVVHPRVAADFTSHHERTFETTARPTATIKRDIPNVGEASLQPLGEDGVIRVGESVSPGTILVGMVEPRGRHLSSEEKLLVAIFGDATGDMRDVSLRAPGWFGGTVGRVERKGDTVAVTVLWERPLEVGDDLDIDGETARVCAIEELDADLGWHRSGRFVATKVASARERFQARAVGPYESLPSQPVASKDGWGGQIITRKQAQRLAEHAPCVLWEMFVAKSDQASMRTRAFESLMRLEPPHLPVPRAASDKPDGSDIFSFIAASGAPAREIPHVVELIEAGLQGLGLWVRFDGDPIEVVAQNDFAVREQSHGPVTRAVLDDEDWRNEAGGLHCQKIFGPIADYRCACGKYGRMKHRCIVCEVCGVEVLQSDTRATRFGHLELFEERVHPVTGKPVNTFSILPPMLRTPQIDACYLKVVESNDAADSHALGAALSSLTSAIGTHIETLWRERLFTKRVNFSASASVVVTDRASPDTCMLPIEVATELFRPVAYGTLESLGYTVTIRSAKQMIATQGPQARAAVRVACEGYPVLLLGTKTHVTRKVAVWDEPAIGVDDKTFRKLGGRDAAVHVPWVPDAVAELVESDPCSIDAAVPAWIEQASRAALIPAVVQAASEGYSASMVEDPLIAIALGRAPRPHPRAGAFRDAERRRWDERCADVIGQHNDEHAEREPQPWESEAVENALSQRTSAVLHDAGIFTLGELCQRTEAELLKLRGVDRGRLLEIKYLFEDMGLSLGMRLD